MINVRNILITFDCDASPASAESTHSYHNPEQRSIKWAPCDASFWHFSKTKFLQEFFKTYALDTLLEVPQNYFLTNILFFLHFWQGTLQQKMLPLLSILVYWQMTTPTLTCVVTSGRNCVHSVFMFCFEDQQHKWRCLHWPS